MTSIQPAKGLLLISEPSIILDADFNRSVILLADHSKNGSVGFILNKPLQVVLSDILPDIDVNFNVYNGGPVEQDNLYFIHNIPHLIPKSIEISNGVFWGGNFETIKILINQKKISADNIRFFLGYTGWAAQQLNGEMKEKTWIVMQNIYHNEILGKSVSSFWKEKIEELGDQYIIWSNAPENPLLN